MKSVHAPIPTNEERAAQYMDAERRSTRDEWRLRIETLVGCVLFSCTGIFFVAWSAHTSDPWMGWIYYWFGLVIGNVGMLFFLLRYSRRRDALGL